ncbi:MAG: GNAT family N-acetyltransferase [Anaerolineae bacterium]|nr:GNAT family N-acetyltransferase [Anaerolineae bacterium]
MKGLSAWEMGTTLHQATPFTSRLYETEHDLRQMQALLMEGRSRTDDWRYWHVGDLTWWFFMVACHLDPQQHIRLWHDGDKLAGYAILGEDPTLDFHVLPGYEWSGIEAEAMAWADTRLMELCRRDAGSWGGDLTSGARQDDPERIAFLEQHGFRRGDYVEVNFLRSLDEPVAEAALPAGCRVRTFAGASEISSRAAAQREVWQPWTVGNVGDDDYAYFMRLPGYRRDLDVVATAPDGPGLSRRDGVIAAYVNGWIDPVNRIGDFGPVGALPAYRRQGLTRAVLLECMRRMQALGMDRVSVSTGESNTPALRLYESVGFKRVNRYLTYVR